MSRVDVIDGPVEAARNHRRRPPALARDRSTA